MKESHVRNSLTYPQRDFRDNSSIEKANLDGTGRVTRIRDYSLIESVKTDAGGRETALRALLSRITAER